MAYEHIFFDLDRTLWDFDRNSELALKQLFSELDIANRTEVAFEQFIQTYRKVNEECWALYRQGLMEKEELRYRRFHLALHHFGVDDEKLAKSIGEGYVEISPRMTQLVDGTEEVLDYLQDKYHLHIITNGFKEVQHIKLNNSGIGHHFRELIISEDVGYKKPHREVFDFALQKAGASSKESLMIGDDLEADIIGARGAGWDQVFYNPYREKHKESIAHEVQHLKELMNIL